MNEALIVLLAFIWALVLLPSALRSRRSNPRTTVGGFTRAMDVLGTAPGEAAEDDADGGVDATSESESPARRDRPPAWARPPRTPRVVEPRARRRLRLLLLLVVLTASAVVTASLLGGRWWPVAAGTGALLVVDLVFLRRSKLQRDFARDIVHAFAPEGSGPAATTEDTLLAGVAGAGRAGRHEPADRG